MVELELGNIVFNTNKNQQYKCDNYVIALLREIDFKLDIVMKNIYQIEYDSPFENTGNKFKNDVFEVQAYSWNDEEQQLYNFKCGNIEISWYKWLGRDTTINGEYNYDTIIDMFNKCIKSLDDLQENHLKENE